MAKYNEILVGRYNRFLTKLLQIKGGAPAPQLAGDIGATINLFNGNENRYLEGWSRFGMSGSLAAGGAGTFSHVRLRNPATSNVIAVVEKILVAQASATDNYVLQHGAATTDLATILGTGARWDNRTNPQGACIYSQQTLALTNIGNNKLLFNLAINQQLDLIISEGQEITILPGDGIQIQGGVANVANDEVSIWWRERFLEESERT